MATKAEKTKEQLKDDELIDLRAKLAEAEAKLAERQIPDHQKGKHTVYFKNGTHKFVPPGPALDVYNNKMRKKGRVKSISPPKGKVKAEVKADD